MSTPLIETVDLSREFRRPIDVAGHVARRLGVTVNEDTVHAVDHINLSVFDGEVVGLVGESGCGKSTLGRLITGLIPPTSGSIRYRGKDIASLSKNDSRDFSLNLQMIFQDPYASLNPRMKVREIVGEAAAYHNLIARGAVNDYVAEMLVMVGLDESYLMRYPHQFSGGQRQRVGIARALAVKPSCIVCDEAVAALDVSIQAQIINLFIELRQKLSLTLLFISHDLSVVEHLCDRVAIMYLGRIVEQGTVEEVFSRPNHPYTQALLSEVPRLDTGRRTFTAIQGEIPSPLSPPDGCHFHPRCPKAMEVCSVRQPTFSYLSTGHESACHLNTTN